MKSKTGPQPTISIDLVKPRIRIHKSTLQLMGNPEYIYLLINPTERLIALKVAARSDPRAHHLSWSALHHKASFEIYSVSLLEMLISCSGWPSRNRYRICGRFISEHNIVQFRIDDARAYNPTEPAAGRRINDDRCGEDLAY